jgi:hypothetical protein
VFRGLFSRCAFGVSSFVLQNVLIYNYMNSNFKAKHESQQSSSLIRPSVTHVCFETSLCVHVFMCVTLLVVIMLGANLIAFDKVVS